MRKVGNLQDSSLVNRWNLNQWSCKLNHGTTKRIMNYEFIWIPALWLNLSLHMKSPEYVIILWYIDAHVRFEMNTHSVQKIGTCGMESTTRFQICPTPTFPDGILGVAFKRPQHGWFLRIISQSSLVRMYLFVFPYNQRAKESQNPQIDGPFSASKARIVKLVYQWLATREVGQMLPLSCLRSSQQ